MPYVVGRVVVVRRAGVDGEAEVRVYKDDVREGALLRGVKELVYLVDLRDDCGFELLEEAKTGDVVRVEPPRNVLRQKLEDRFPLEAAAEAQLRNGEILFPELLGKALLSEICSKSFRTSKWSLRH